MPGGAKTYHMVFCDILAKQPKTLEAYVCSHGATSRIGRLGRLLMESVKLAERYVTTYVITTTRI